MSGSVFEELALKCERVAAACGDGEKLTSVFLQHVPEAEKDEYSEGGQWNREHAFLLEVIDLIRNNQCWTREQWEATHPKTARPEISLKLQRVIHSERPLLMRRVLRAATRWLASTWQPFVRKLEKDNALREAIRAVLEVINHVAASEGEEVHEVAHESDSYPEFQSPFADEKLNDASSEEHAEEGANKRRRGEE